VRGGTEEEKGWGGKEERGGGECDRKRRGRRRIGKSKRGMEGGEEKDAK